MVHAPFAAPERRAQFERSLRGVGVEDFQVVEAKRVGPDDPRAHTFRSPAALSLADAIVRAIETARDAGWQSVAIFEDDVIFRRRFAARWAHIEPDVRRGDWDVLTLYRWPWREVIIERPLARTRLLPIRWTLTTHAFAIRASGFGLALQAIAECIAEGKQVDFFTGRVTRAGGKVVATSHNLAGQTSMSGKSTIDGKPTGGTRKWRRFRTEFGSYRSPAGYAFAATARAVLGFGRRVKQALAGR